MSSIKFKKGLSLLLSIIMIFTMMPTTIFTLGANAPVMRAYPTFNEYNKLDYHGSDYKAKIVTVTFVDKIDTSGATISWDVSENGDSSVMAWIKVNSAESTATATKYDLYIGGNGGVTANTDSGNLFLGFSALKEINGLENFYTENVTSFESFLQNCTSLESADLSALDTSNATNFSYFFSGCSKLVSLDLSTFDTSKATTFFYMFSGCSVLKSVDMSFWNTSNVTNMSYMFYNCKNLKSLDLSSFNTSKVTTMTYLFFNCYVLEKIYIGDGWDIENVENGSSVFNCCYALPGWDNNNNTHISAFDTQYKKGFEKIESQKKTYTVTYKYTGDVHPENEPPVPVDPYSYAAGAPVTVAADNKVVGYTFSGWTTEDATIENGQFTMPEKDVVLEGSWKVKNYTVTYRHEGDVPEGFETIVESYQDGKTVTIETPSVDGYIFEGWTTEDIAESDKISNTEFTINNNVTFYGKWTKLYKVTYVYTEGYEVPGDAPDLENDEKYKVEYYKSGDTVTIKDAPYVKDYTFEGWTTKDADIEGHHFTMPAKDVILEGYFKKPVDKIEINEAVDNVLVVEFGKETVIHVVFTPSDSTNKDVIFVSGNEDIVKVDENGKVTPVHTGTTTITVISKDNEEIQITINVEVVKYKVSYVFDGVKPDGVELPETKDYSSGNNVTVEPYPNADGYTFEYWIDGVRVDPSSTFVMPEKNVEIVVKWAKKNYKVTYAYTTGDIIPEDAYKLLPEEKEYSYKASVEVAAARELDGYTFSGWTPVNENVTVGEDGKFTMPAEDVHFVGSWEIKNYTVTYAYTGDIIPEDADKLLPEEKEYSYKASVEVATAPTLKGYTFSGWTTKDAAIENGKFTMPANDVVLVGSWEVKNYTVTYKYTGDVPTGFEGFGYTHQEGTTVTVDDVPTAPYGYEFSGWTTEDVDITSGSFEINKHVTIVGKWTKIPEYKVTYQYTGDVPTDAVLPEGKTNQLEGTEITVAALPEVPAGYIFHGWTTEDADIKNDKFNIYNDVVITGNWTKIPEYKVTYQYTGDVPEKAPTVPVDENSYKKNVSVTVAAAPTLDGYTFSGWKPVNENVTVGEDGKFTMPAEDVHFVGSWSNIPVESIAVEKTEFDLEPGDTDKIVVIVTPEDAFDKTIKYESKDEKVVIVDETGKITAVGEGDATITITSNDGSSNVVTVTVNVKAKTYNVTYAFTNEAPNSDIKAPGEATYKAGTTVKVEGLPEVPDGYKFSGWTPENNVDIENGEFVINNDVHFVGTWSKIPVESITVEKTEFDLEPGDTDNIKVTVTPEDAFDKTIIYESSNDEVVTVDETGKITAVGEGEAIITVTSKEKPSAKTEITVTVTKPVVYYTVTYKYKGNNYPEDVPPVPETKTYEAGTEVTVAKNPESIPGKLIFLGWKKGDVEVPEGSKFIINSDVTLVGDWHVFVSDITAPEKIEIVLGMETNIGASVTVGATNQKLHYRSDNEAVAKVDAEGTITTYKAGTANIYITADANPDIIKVVTVTVVDEPKGEGEHYMVFGKTEKIGWYTVSFDNGKTWQTVFGNSNHVVKHGSEVIIRANDVFGDPFTFYINGKAVTPDENGYVRVTLDTFVLVGALGIPVIAPDGYEALNWFQKLIQSIKDFFAKIAAWFKK